MNRQSLIRPARTSMPSGVLLTLLIVVGVMVTTWLVTPSEEDWLWPMLSGLFWTVVALLGLVIGLALLTFLLFLTLFLIDLSRASPMVRRRLVSDFRTFATVFGVSVGIILVLILILPVVLLCLPFWLAAVVSELMSMWRRTRTARQLCRLRQVSRQPTPRALRFCTGLLTHADPDIRREAFATTANLLRRERPDRVSRWQPLLTRSLPDQVRFAQTLAEMAPQVPLAQLVTLGAKLGAGTSDKRVSPATSDPAKLSAWLKSHQRSLTHRALMSEVQISIGHDTGPLPNLVERGRFLALYLFVATTELERFEALTRRPARDPNAAHGLLIRGDRVEVLYPGQGEGRRLDFIFPYPAELSEANLTEFLCQLQLLGLGLLLTSVQESYRQCLIEEPNWWTPSMTAVADEYRLFERRLVSWLRQHDAHRQAELIHPLQADDHAERQKSFGKYRLEECLYPRYQWLVPLYADDASWDRLLPALRTVEGIMLHQGWLEDEELTRGSRFIRGTRRLGYESALAIREALNQPSLRRRVPIDPFIDAADQAATVEYLRTIAADVQRGAMREETLPDLATYRSASLYYGISQPEASPV